jgi:hypothetical protein
MKRCAAFSVPFECYQGEYMDRTVTPRRSITTLIEDNYRDWKAENEFHKPDR